MFAKSVFPAGRFADTNEKDVGEVVLYKLKTFYPFTCLALFSHVLPRENLPCLMEAVE